MRLITMLKLLISGRENESAEEVSSFYRELKAFRAEIRADHDRIESKIDDIMEDFKGISDD